MEHEGEKQAETVQTLAQAAGLREMDTGKTTLKIWDTPLPLAQKFIGISKSSYANKSWLYLQDLMQKADKYDQWLASGKIAEIDAMLKLLDGRIGLIEIAICGEDDQNKETKTAKKPKTLGEIHE